MTKKALALLPGLGGDRLKLDERLRQTRQQQSDRQRIECALQLIKEKLQTTIDAPTAAERHHAISAMLSSVIIYFYTVRGFPYELLRPLEELALASMDAERGSNAEIYRPANMGQGKSSKGASAVEWQCRVFILVACFARETLLNEAEPESDQLKHRRERQRQAMVDVWKCLEDKLGRTVLEAALPRKRGANFNLLEQIEQWRRELDGTAGASGPPPDAILMLMEMLMTSARKNPRLEYEACIKGATQRIKPLAEQRQKQSLRAELDASERPADPNLPFPTGRPA